MGHARFSVRKNQIKSNLYTKCFQLQPVLLPHVASLTGKHSDTLSFYGRSHPILRLPPLPYVIFHHK
jgi:hypothetical protein